MIKNSIRQLLRTPIKTTLFLLLILIAGMYLTLGISLWVINNRNIEFYENSFITIGTVEQRETSIEQVERWDAVNKEYVIIQVPTYGKIIPLSVLDFEGAQYIHKPEKRPYYASYNPEFKLEEKYSGLSVVEIIPQEDGLPNEPVSVKISRLLYGKQFIAGQTIDICDPALVDPEPLYKGKTYVLCIQEIPTMDGDQWRSEYYPHSVILSSQYNPDGIRMQSDLEEDSLYYEVTEDFYNKGIGKRFLEFIESMELDKYSIPVTGTNATILLMPFYNKDAYLIQGRDITDDEYEKGEKVCLIPSKLAKDNNLGVGESVNLKLYSANYYQSAAGLYFDTSIIAELNAKGEAYSVFEDSDYIIVGIYDTDPGAINGSYGLAKNEVIIPSKSIKNSDENNIVGYGPMRGNTTSFQIPNGSTEEFMKKWGKLGYDQLEINFYDRGYTKLKAGMDNMKNMSLTLAIVGFVMVVFILLFFSHQFIIKQERRTAIERSLGMGKGKCMVSLLSGISIILILGSVLGSSAGGGISLWLSQKDVNDTYYSTMYSGGMTEEINENVRDWAEDIPIVIRISALSMSLIILLGEGISIVQMNRSLRKEPMELLCRPKE